MQVQPFSRVERDDVLRHYEAQDYSSVFMDMEKYEAVKLPEAEAERLDVVCQRLPRMVLGRCPFDDKPLVRTFDPYGLAGRWWRPRKNSLHAGISVCCMGCPP